MKFCKFLVFALLSATAASAQAQPQVSTGSGVLNGKAQGGVDAFLGVPYAAPPVGALRWRAPQPARAWSGQRDATRFGAACYQWRLP